MGATGYGRSTFISLLAQEGVIVGHPLESCTTEVEMLGFIKGGRVGYLIDTPDFDVTTCSETDILNETMDVLNRLDTQRIRLTGLIYLHRITDVMMQGSTVRNLDMLLSLRGEDAFPNNRLVSTMWQTLDDQRFGVERETILKSNQRFGGPIWKDTDQVKRHPGDVTSAREIVSWLINREDKMVLDVQRQMVDEGLMLDETTARKYLSKDLNKLRKRYEKEMEQLKQNLKEARQAEDTVTKELLLRQNKKFDSKLATAVVDEQDLRVSSQDLQTESSLELERRMRELEHEKNTDSLHTDRRSAPSSTSKPTARIQVHDVGRST
jgi:hypothetical protein